MDRHRGRVGMAPDRATGRVAEVEIDRLVTLEDIIRQHRDRDRPGCLIVCKPDQLPEYRGVVRTTGGRSVNRIEDCNSLRAAGGPVHRHIHSAGSGGRLLYLVAGGSKVNAPGSVIARGIKRLLDDHRHMVALGGRGRCNGGIIRAQDVHEEHLVGSRCKVGLVNDDGNDLHRFSGGKHNFEVGVRGAVGGESNVIRQCGGAAKHRINGRPGGGGPCQPHFTSADLGQLKLERDGL